MATGTYTLDDFTALNDQLAALIEAGIPIGVTLNESGVDPSRMLESINSIVSRRVRHGESLLQALEGDEHDLPDSYRRLMQLAARAGNFDAALAGSNRLAAAAVESRYAAGSALFYPLIVLGLAFIGLIAFCMFFVPTLENMYDSLRLVPGRGLQFLRGLRQWLPYWAAGVPTIVLLVVAWRVRARLRQGDSNRMDFMKARLLPGSNEAEFQLRCASFAEALAEMLGNGVPLDEGLRLAGEASGDAALREGAGALAASLAEGQLPPEDGPFALCFPPFLRWALWRSEATAGRERALRMAAQIYHEVAERRFERVRTVVPFLTLVVIGGGATLLYGLTLFVPVVELLRALAA